MKHSSALVLATPLLALAAACGGSSSSATPVPTVTVTVPVTPSATSSPSAAPVQQTSAPSATSSSTGSSSGSGAVVTGAGSRFTKPASPTVKPYTLQSEANSAETCKGLIDGGFQENYCTSFRSKLGTAVFVLEYKGAEERSLVYTVASGRASLALRSVRQRSSGSNSGDMTRGSVSDLANDKTDKAVFLTPQGDSADSYASVDVVEASGKVVLHRALSGGTARKAFGGGLETYVPASGGQATDTVIQFLRGAWRVTSTKTVSSSSIPDSTGSF